MKFSHFLFLLIFTLIACKSKISEDIVPVVAKPQTVSSEVKVKQQFEIDSITSIDTSNEIEEMIVQEVDSIKTKPIKKNYSEITFESLSIDLDTITEGDIVNKKFNFTNSSQQPLKIYKTDVSCGCTVPSYPFLDIMPGEKGFIGVTYNSVGKEGLQKPQIKVYTNTKDSPITLNLNVYVQNQE